MATEMTPEEAARGILDIFVNHFHIAVGRALGSTNVMHVWLKRGLQMDDMKAGFKYAAEAGWLADGPNGGVVLTQAGFDEA
ncbi:hypothetical protein [Burkholderia vietnamiensis]|uniref:hypothetical protein n=1 Tax=Burkholderia vietnamiensis TaxID=60552 RepID=UPI00264F1ECF|nr:hypothetical protein [Burkholderia vietnamiensis]MDN8039282.1 hypothetical protein [Burkholderia vietnamiensis]